MVCSVEDIKRAIAAFPPVGCDFAGLLRSLSIEEQTALTAISGAEAYVRTTELDIVSLQTKLEIARSKSGEIKKLQDEAGRYAEVIAKYSLLMKACSNDGIIALELDDASPSIAAVVNDLLRACYGTRFSVRLDTQTAKVSGDMKESFDIVILDSETGDERSITECSGGQVTVIEDAITRGICLYNIHRSDRGYDTLYSDEKDGALDEFRKIEFMKVKREALRIGTHSREIFITQTQDLVDMADARIVLAPGGIIFQ
jgi:exonuclease SbcC